MLPCSFDESNAVLSRPPSMNPDQCEPLSIYKGGIRLGGEILPCVISCWKCTAEELQEIQRTGRVWVNIIGNTMPPIIVSGTLPFVQAD
jgi:hypothetical protein